MALLELNHLHTYFRTPQGILRAVDDVSYGVGAGKTLGIVGESGSGKSVSAMSILRLLGRNGYHHSGAIHFNGRDLCALSDEEMYRVRGNEIATIFQEPMTSLNPVFSIQRQLGEAFLLHQGLSKREADARAISMLTTVNIPAPERVAKQYPHELSGGMRQRVMIAMALSCQPKLLIADEPTTALDVTIQAQILALMNELKAQQGMSILFITHDLGVIRQMADTVAVMYCGQVVESGPIAAIFGGDTVLHPYTKGLMDSVPHLDTPLGTRLAVIPGTVPHPLSLPTGCRFAPRCSCRTPRCDGEMPELTPVGPDHQIRCFYPLTGGRH